MTRLHEFDAAQGRRPSLQEAADFLMKMDAPQMLGYRRRCLAHWRELFGDPFADAVAAAVRRRWQRR